MQRYGSRYTQRQYVNVSISEPLIEVEGKLRFSLRGMPLLPSLSDDTILKPTSHWVLNTDQSGKLNAELSYITQGMSWKADYSMLAAEKGDELDVIGWVTIDNQSGKTFDNARIKLAHRRISAV